MHKNVESNTKNRAVSVPLYDASFLLLLQGLCCKQKESCFKEFKCYKIWIEKKITKIVYFLVYLIQSHAFCDLFQEEN